MALPAAPATITVKRGNNPGDVLVTVAAVVATPAVTSYDVYLGPDSSVTPLKYRRHKSAAGLIYHFNVQDDPMVWATATATNSAGAGPAVAAASGHPRQ
jgi:hypothetical protein